MILTCKYCGKEFSVENSYYRRNSKLWDSNPFCSLQHRMEFAEAEIKRLRSSNEPLIEVGVDDILCRVCGMRLKSIGSHMSMVHGVETKGIGHLARNILLGLKHGERAVTSRMINQMRDRARNDPNFYLPTVTINDYKINWSEIGKLRSLIKPSDDVVTRCIQNAHASHEAACSRREERRCWSCGELFRCRNTEPSKNCARCRHLAHIARMTKGNTLSPEIASLYSRGIGTRAIASMLGINRKTVQRVVRETNA